MNIFQFKYHLLQLNRKSKEMLAELESENPNHDRIRDCLDKRESMIGKMFQAWSSGSFTELTETERKNIKQQFRYFDSLHENIERHLKDILSDKRRTLDSAIQKREAEDGYRLFG